MVYEQRHLVTQRNLALAQLSSEQNSLNRLDQITEDVRENHRNTINMRIKHYVARIAALDDQIVEIGIKS